MLLMQSTDKDFKGMAATVVADHLSHDKSITDCIAELAKQRNLNPEEIKRLTEKSNTQLALQHLRGENKKDTFELARYSDVLKKTHPVDEEYEAEEEETDFPDDEGNLDDKEDDKMEKEDEKTETRHVKTASLIPHTRRRNIPDAFPALVMEKEASRPRMSSKDVFSLKKFLDEKKLEKTAAETSMMESIDSLTSTLRSKPEQYFEKFAANSVAVYGDEVRNLLAKFAEFLNYEPVMEKTAESYIDDSDPMIVEMGKVCDGVHAVMQKQAEIEEIEAALKWCMKEAVK